jgi:hypothetical protein
MRAMRRSPLVLLLALPLAIPAAADARTITSSNAYAFGQGDVNCYVVMPIAGKGIECTSQGVPRSGGEGDPYVALRTSGSARVAARGDFPGYSVPRRKLRTGDTWRPSRSAKGIVCRLSSKRLTCTNRSGHGFRIGPKSFSSF